MGFFHWHNPASLGKSANGSILIVIVIVIVIVNVIVIVTARRLAL